MTPEEQKDLKSRINQEGFGYCFMHYSDFKEINDPKFHALRLAYQNAHSALEFYIENNWHPMFGDPKK